jgi:sulfur relay protein TusB/DsrH
MVRTTVIALRSPQEQDLAPAVGRVASKEEASLILFEDAVYNALHTERATELAKVAGEVLVAEDDLRARGFSQSDLRTGRTVPYADIVDCIMERTERTVTL